MTWSLEGEDASRFTVNASTGVVSMVARDYEVPVDVGANNSYNYTLKATDKAGNTATQAVAISITNSTSGDNSPPTGEVLITGAYQSGQTLKASSFIRYNSYLTGTATRISTAGTVADFDPINSTFVMEGGWVGVDSNDTRGAAAIVRNVDTSVAGQLTFWVMAFDDNKTKAVQVRLANMSAVGFQHKPWLPKTPQAINVQPPSTLIQEETSVPLPQAIAPMAWVFVRQIGVHCRH